MRDLARELARRELASLVALGLLRRVGQGRGARYVPDAKGASMTIDGASDKGFAVDEEE
ncbi:MAG: hypothetical protein FJ029_09345 [Actinobacteria bacterium]|nr:hypothetical protein [Actinomycetota bacterium]